ncbi:nicotinamidase [Aliidiomarina minuta]|uniref:nicotinamidase n=1 Tax=Aliidiomarina minuta TaxID=880057 RepID=A0A432W3N0_9GAMM|nr:nicotinamidase [Aliidiomarina minuta]RUO23938.1 nicotinamidase [Aliidiomarina minuta]
MNKQLQTGDALLIVDVQNDFCPGGKLGVEDGDTIVPVLNQWIAQAETHQLPVFASRDWHPLGHLSFSEQGGPWPEHCVQDTPGAAFHSDLQLPKNSILISKGARFDKDQYSAFDDTGLAEELHKRGIKRLWVGGLAQEVCVQATALDAREAGFETLLIQKATRAIDAKDGEQALKKMRDAGVILQD